MKPGWKTTEFYVHLLVATINALVVSDLLVPGSTAMKIVSLVALILQAFGYQVSRTRAKAAAAVTMAEPAEVRSPPSQGGFVRMDAMLVMLSIAALAVGIGSGCGASARDTSIRTTFSALTVAQTAFVAWDLEHQRTIIRAAATEADAQLKLAEYKLKREPVVGYFEVAYKMLAAAGALEDDPSLAGALKAWTQLAEALKILTGGKLP
jgi:hypothetical protein